MEKAQPYQFDLSADVLFAINEQYWMNEKGAVAIVDGVKKSPARIKEQVESTVSQLDNNSRSIVVVLQSLREKGVR